VPLQQLVLVVLIPFELRQTVATATRSHGSGALTGCGDRPAGDT
jgi:hypothetical protein